MTTLYYNLRIQSSNSQEIRKILGYGECINDKNFQYQLIDGDQKLDIIEEYVLHHYLNLLEKNIKSLRNIDSGIKMTLRLTYEYDDQCNMEFTTDDIKRMADLGIYLCISAYQFDENQENWVVKYA